MCAQGPELNYHIRTHMHAHKAGRDLKRQTKCRNGGQGETPKREGDVEIKTEDTHVYAYMHARGRRTSACVRTHTQGAQTNFLNMSKPIHRRGLPSAHMFT